MYPHILQFLPWTDLIFFTSLLASSSSSQHVSNAPTTVSNTLLCSSNCFAMSKVVSSPVINYPVPYLRVAD